MSWLDIVSALVTGTWKSPKGGKKKTKKNKRRNRDIGEGRSLPYGYSRARREFWEHEAKLAEEKKRAHGGGS